MVDAERDGACGVSLSSPGVLSMLPDRGPTSVPLSYRVLGAITRCLK